MQEIIKNTFGGLSKEYYIRQLIFSFIICSFVIYITLNSRNPSQIAAIFFLVVNTFLYPYSRFVYESMVNFILGENVLYSNIILTLFVKSTTMLLCWAFAVLIAPLGLIYLFFINRKKTANKSFKTDFLKEALSLSLLKTL